MATEFQCGSDQPGVTSPVWRAAIVAPDDANDLTVAARAIALGAAGDLKVTTYGGDILTIPSGALVAGVLHPIMIRRVWATGTTATGLVVFW